MVMTTVAAFATSAGERGGRRAGRHELVHRARLRLCTTRRWPALSRCLGHGLAHDAKANESNGFGHRQSFADWLPG